ncbi:LysR family transcriptional regulator [Mesorhizobium sp.]|uniref:LysR family transcriptional regulator n=1 Tax=Mesorhizobium sp. TaxID=1871066 RepID=UPI000FE6848A|nr:LysR family transcriptional regulator [Mesorhizobium sp.]RWE79558.1 MAG: LysR family transcriptional regulator [Mesorhizobium sp.]
MDRLGPLNAFVQAAEYRSFTAAGRELGISASGIGKAISRLEERLKVQLFHRNTRNISLTPAGEQFLKRCQKIFEEINAAELEIAESTNEAKGKLRVSLPLIGMLMIPTLAAFATAFPDVELDMDFSDRLVDVVEEGFDVVIRTGKVNDSTLMMRKLGTYSYVVVGSPAYLETHGVPERPEDLAQHSCLYHRWASTGKLERWEFTEGGQALDLAPREAMVASTMEPLINLAERHIGLVYTPTFSVRSQLHNGTLQSVLDPYIKSIGTLQALFPPSRHQSPKVRAFVDFMAQYLLTERPR